MIDRRGAKGGGEGDAGEDVRPGGRRNVSVGGSISLCVGCSARRGQYTTHRGQRSATRALSSPHLDI
eukprot:185624-Rhodomonas_salina.1